MERQLLELKTAAPIVDWPITNESNGNLWGEGGGEPGGWDRVKNDDQAISFDSLPEAASGNNTAPSPVAGTRRKKPSLYSRNTRPRRLQSAPE